MSSPTTMVRADDLASMPRAVVDRAFDLLRAFLQADLVDPSISEQVPNRTSLVLIPDDDPELAAYAIKTGVAAVEQGRSMYFLHLTHSADGTVSIKRSE